jgi:hypothetical protein
MLVGAMDGRGLLSGNDFLWAEHRRLSEANATLAHANARLSRERDGFHARLAAAEAEARRLDAENRLLRRRVKDLAGELKAATAAAAARPGAPPPPFVKANVTPGRWRRKAKPGRRFGHAAALRPPPPAVDTHQHAPLPIDASGKPSCPHCKTQLSDVEGHERLVEDLVPQRVVVTCYHTASGYCPSCRRRVESRAAGQPPAPRGGLPHAQLGIEALSTAALLRVAYRLPFRSVASLLSAVPGLTVSPGALVKQLKRMARWLRPEYERIRAALRVASVLHADETHWRVDGKNGHLWTLTEGDGDPHGNGVETDGGGTGRHTLYHVDRSRGGKVIRKLLGAGHGADGGTTLVSDFYGAYDTLAGAKQKCLAHLLRELKETVAARPATLAGHAFFKPCRRLIRDMLRLRQRKGELEEAAYARRVRRVETRLATLAEGDWADDPDATRLAKRLSKHRASLTRFLHDPAVPATNNAAERALRPAVVMRKITGGSRALSGAEAWSVLASVMRTAQQHGRDVAEELRTQLKRAWSAETGTG